MDRRAGRLAQWLGGPVARQRRHRKLAFAAVVVLAIAGLLVVFGGGDDDDGFADAATPVCAEFGDRIQQEYALLFPEGPINDEAGAEYLSRAFADTMDELVVALRDLEPSGDAADAVDALASRLEEVRETPGDFVRSSPLAGVAERFDDVDLAACGSEFLAPPE